LFGAEGHDFVVGLDVDFVEDAFAEQLLVVGGRRLADGFVAVHLEGAGADLVGNEAVAFGL
jgi:hypothetical protein